MSWPAAALVASAATLAPLPTTAPEPRTATAVAGAHYAAGALHRLLLGADYRDLWTTPIEVEVLDLETEAGGLTPVRRVGGAQTRGLALRGVDGRDYTFRSLDKDPSELLPPDLRDTFADRLLQDQIAASHPGAAPVAAEITRAAGVLTTSPRLVALPDHPRLGEFRAVFAGVLGTFEEYPQPGFAGATEIIDHVELWRRMDAGPEDRPDARALLRARLLDLLLGDFDRHRKQWRWARLPGRPGWQPIAEDRDQAFARYEGLVLAVGRHAQPRFVVFGPEYPSMEGLTWNGYDVDRRILTGLDAAAWREVALEVQSRVTDGVLRRAVGRLPEAWQGLDGDRLLGALRARRDALPHAARRFYRHLAAEVDVHGTGRDEVAEVTRLPGGEVDVRLRLDRPDAPPYFARRFRPTETREVRLYLGAGNDRVVTRGGPGQVVVRVLGGPGDDRVDDQLGGGAHVSDHEGRDEVRRGKGTSWDRGPYTPPPGPPRAPWIPARDWGRRTIPTLWMSGGPDLGLFAGGGVLSHGYAFRRHPFADRHLLRAGWATAAAAGRAEYDGTLHRENSRTSLHLAARASGIEILRFHGFGNETASTAPDDFYEVRQQQFSLAPDLALRPAARITFTIGPRVQWSTTDLEEASLVALRRPYGTEDFGQAGAAAALRLDTRDAPTHPTRGVHLWVEGRVFPRVWSVDETFGGLRGEGSAYLTAGGALRPTLALRAGGARVFGRYPFHEAAFLGATASLRGLPKQRFAGDGAAWGGAELRARLGRASLVVPGEVGAFILYDVGRVFRAGEDSGRWHGAQGGGLWFSFLERANTLTVSVARSRERTAFYVGAGFAF